MNKFLKFIFVFIAILLFFFLLAFVLYKSNASPDFNNFVNSLLKFNNEELSDLSTDNQGTSTEENDVITENTISNRIPVLLPFEKPSTEDSFITYDFSLTNDNYNLSFNQSTWTYNNSYPIVSEPMSFADSVVFIDAEPALVCLEKNTGTLQYRLPCGILPAGPAYSEETNYYFQGKVGGWFQIQFQDNLTEFPVTLELQKHKDIQNNFSERLASSVFPDTEGIEVITTTMNNYVSSLERVALLDVLLYDISNQLVEFQHTVFSPLYIFSPEEQGSYTFGLCDSQGSWIKGNAFVVLFSKNGEVEAISLDYVADRPQISIHLSDTQLYYVCCGFMGTEEHSTAFFQVKKDP